MRLQVTDNLGAQDLSDPITISAQSAGGGASYSASVLADSPLSYWRLGEASGTTAADSSGANRTGSYLNTPTLGVRRSAHRRLQHGRRLQRHRRVRASPLRRCPEPGLLHGRGVGVRHRRPGHLPLARHEPPVRPGAARGYILYAGADNKWQLWTGNGSWNVLGGPAVTLNQWTHVVGSYDGTTMRLYVNGTLAASLPAGYLQNVQRPLRIASGATDLTTTPTTCPGAWTRSRCTALRSRRSRPGPLHGGERARRQPAPGRRRRRLAHERDDPVVGRLLERGLERS